MVKKIFLIAEIGINHNGNLQIAKRLIKLAKDTGFDAVKFQKRSPEITTPENKKKNLRNTPWGAITYLDYKKKIEFGKKEFDAIDDYCKKIDIPWFASPWDIKSNQFLKNYNCKYSKVASPVITNILLLKDIAKLKRYTFISTGMCKMTDIQNAVSIFKKARCPFSLLHCVSSYPCEEKDLNLKMIHTLKKKIQS